MFCTCNKGLSTCNSGGELTSPGELQDGSENIHLAKRSEHEKGGETKRGTQTEHPTAHIQGEDHAHGEAP